MTLLSAEVARDDGSFGIPFDHMALRVDLDGRPWLADVGFGESFLRPLPLEERNEGDYRLRQADDVWLLLHGDEAKYRFTLTPRRLEDFARGCEHHQSSPETMFTQKLITTRATPDGGRVTLTPDRLVRHASGERSDEPIRNLDEWRQALAEQFDIVLETDPCGDLF